MDQEIKAYEGAENFRLIYRCNINLSTYPPTVVAIEYLAPGSDVIATWTASVLTGSETTGDIYHDFGAGSAVPAAGDYKIRGKLTIGGKIVYCKPRIWMVGKFTQ